MDLTKAKHIHFSGIKGVGMTALALYAQDMGIKVSGSDLKEEFVTDKILKKRKIPISIGFSKNNILKQTQVIIYTAARPRNPQVIYGEKKGIITLSYAQALAKFISKKKTIAVCGVGGKTTTSSMIATILTKARINPSFIIGVGNIPGLEVPGKFAKGKQVVVEADDYVAIPKIDNTPKFLYLNPQVIVATNIEYDHPDVFSNLNQTMSAFVAFFNKLPKGGLLVANIDSKNVQTALRKLNNNQFKAKVITYGFSPQADWKIIKVKTIDKATFCSIQVSGIKLDFILQVPGKFNVANACAALIVSTQLGISQKIAIETIAKFSGTMRRFQKVGVYNNAEIWDDYAHHPSEIEATLNAAKSWFPKKNLIALFQPHTYSRTKALLEDFSKCFSWADEVIITNIFSSEREEKDLSISGSLLAQLTNENHKKVKFIPISSMLEYLRKSIKTNDILLTLGAGDIYKIAETLVKRNE